MLFEVILECCGQVVQLKVYSFPRIRSIACCANVYDLSNERAPLKYFWPLLGILGWQINKVSQLVSLIVKNDFYLIKLAGSQFDFFCEFESVDKFDTASFM